MWDCLSCRRQHKCPKKLVRIINFLLFSFLSHAYKAGKWMPKYCLLLQLYFLSTAVEQSSANKCYCAFIVFEIVPLRF